MTPTVLKWRKNEQVALPHVQLEGIFLCEISGQSIDEEWLQFHNMQMAFQTPYAALLTAGREGEGWTGKTTPVRPQIRRRRGELREGRREGLSTRPAGSGTASCSLI